MSKTGIRIWDTPFPSRITPISVRRWIKDFPTPFYVYDKATLLKRIEEVKNFPHPGFSKFTPRYAIKANPSRALIEILDKSGIAFDASSGFEVERLIKIGVDPKKILLTSQEIPFPEKKFKNFFGRGLNYNATSLRQLEWYGRLCSGNNISLRINPGFGSGMDKKTIVGGSDSGFGIWHEHYIEMLSLCRKYCLIVERIHTHVGSGSDPRTWMTVTKSTLDLLQYFPSARIINIGGGFKAGRHPREHSSNLTMIGDKVCKLMEAYSKKNSRTFDVEIEPGTYYVAESGLLIAQIEDVITNGKKNPTHFIKLNTGMNDLIRPTLYHSHHHIDVIPFNSRRKPSKSLPYIVIGHCCESGDQISQHFHENQEHAGDKNKATVNLSTPYPGDPVIIHGVGAYGSSMSSRYNSFPFIAEYLFSNDKKDKTSLKVIRKAETLNNVMAREISLNKVNKKK